MTSTDLVAAASALSIMLGALALVGRYLMRPLVVTLRDVREFLREWRGEPARPGHSSVPGIPERLARTESTLDDVDRQLRTNGGSTLRDLAQENRDAIAGVDRRLSDHVEWAERLQAESLDEADRVRVAGHHEAEAMWRALEALSGLRIGRRHGDPVDLVVDALDDLDDPEGGDNG
jgi:hypothetical protein